MTRFWPSFIPQDERDRVDGFIASGKCPGPCGGDPPARGTIFCEDCLHNLHKGEWGRPLYYARRAAGICVECGADYDRGAVCDTCRAKNRIAQRKLYAKLKTHGRCVRHRRRAAAEGTVFCAECRDRYREKRNARPG